MRSAGSNMDVGGRTVELSEFEFVVRGRGYVKSTSDLSNIVLKVEKGTPVLLKDVARIELDQIERRGITELNGEWGGRQRDRAATFRPERAGCDRQCEGSSVRHGVGAA